MSTNTVNANHLRAFIERIERLEEEKRAIADDIKEVYAEAKGTGYDIKIMRKIISLRRQDRDKRREEEEILGLYLSALGDLEQQQQAHAAQVQRAKSKRESQMCPF